jgi:hypothetical protein
VDPSSDPRHDDHRVGGCVGKLVANERMRRAGVVAKAAMQLCLRPDSPWRRDRKIASRAEHRAPGEHLQAVADKAPVLADSSAAGAAELDVGLAAIAGIWSNFEGHRFK